MSYGVGNVKWSWSGDDGATVANVTLELNGSDEVFSSDRSAKVHPKDAADPYVGAAISSARAFRDVADQLEAWAGLQLAGVPDVGSEFLAAYERLLSGLTPPQPVPDIFRRVYVPNADVRVSASGFQYVDAEGREEALTDLGRPGEHSVSFEFTANPVAPPTPPKYDPNWAAHKEPKKAPRSKTPGGYAPPLTKAEAEGRGIHPDHWTRLGVVDA